MNEIPHDKEWFETYINKCSFDDINFIKFDQKNLSEQKELFFAGKINEPTFTYIDKKESLSSYKKELIQLQGIIESDKSNLSVVRQAYLAKISQQLDKVKLIEAMYRADDKKFFDTSLKLYGELKKDEMQGALSTILKIAEHRKFSLSRNFQELVLYFEAVSSKSVSEYAVVENEATIPVDELMKLLEEALLEKNIDWKVRVQDEALAVHLNYGDKTIYIPRNRKVTYVEARSIVEHEVNVHLVRHINGVRSKLLLLSVGLDHYLKGEEGLANYKQTAVDSSLPGCINYITVGLASGLYKNTPWNFREIFDFSKEYLSILGFSEYESAEMSWKRCLRVFRGATGKAGSCFTRDSIYFKGFLEIKNLVKTNDLEVKRFMAGKYDPSNKRHVELLDELEIVGRS